MSNWVIFMCTLLCYYFSLPPTTNSHFGCPLLGITHLKQPENGHQCPFVRFLKFPCFPESVKFPACPLHWQHHQMALSIIRVKTLFLFYVALLCIVHPVSVSSSHFGCPPTTHPLTCESKFRLVSSQTSPAGAHSASYQNSDSSPHFSFYIAASAPSAPSLTFISSLKSCYRSHSRQEDNKMLTTHIRMFCNLVPRLQTAHKAHLLGRPIWFDPHGRESLKKMDFP